MAAKSGSPMLRGSSRPRGAVDPCHLHGSPPQKGKSRGSPTQPGVMQRLLAKRRWAFLWDNENLELVPNPEVAEEGLDERVGFSTEEVKKAVSTASLSEDLQALHEAATVLREVTATGGVETGKLLLRMSVIPALLRLLKQQDGALEEDAIVCFLNMLAHDKLKAVLTDQGLVVPLVQTLKDSKIPSSRANIAACLSLLTRSEAQTWSLLTSGAITTLVDMLKVSRGRSEEENESEGRTPRLKSGRPVKSLGRSGSFLFSPSFSSAGDNSMHDSCLALMHLAKFHTIRRALIKEGIVPILCDIAAIAPVVDSEETVAALFQLLARVDGGPEAICRQDNGAGAKALVQLAETGGEATKELALDALRCAVSRETGCAEALRNHGVYATLATSFAFDNSSEDIQWKVSLTLCAMR